MKCYRKLYYYKEVVLRYSMNKTNNSTTETTSKTFSKTCYCDECNWNEALSFQQLTKKCKEAKYFTKYLPENRLGNRKLCFQCYEGQIENEAEALWDSMRG